MSAPGPAAIAADPRWLPHGFDDAMRRIEFVRLDRADHDTVSFLDNQYLGSRFPRAAAPVAEIATAAAGLPPPAPLHFLFHSTMAASTLTARLFAQPGVAMGLREPAVLNQIAASVRRGVDMRAPLALVLRLLARPFGAGEAVVVKPGNVANLLIPQIMAARPDARALFLHAPLRGFLRSIAKKGLQGRIFYRQLFAKLRSERHLDAGFSEAELFEQTDLQIAALVWLGHHAQFARLAGAFDGRVRTLDSAVLLADQSSALTAIAAHFRLALDVPALLAGPLPGQHAKELGRAFDAADRQREHDAAEAAHGEEIGMVEGWAQAVAAHCRVPLDLPAPLLPRP